MKAFDVRQWRGCVGSGAPTAVRRHHGRQVGSGTAVCSQGNDADLRRPLHGVAAEGKAEVEVCWLVVKGRNDANSGGVGEKEKLL